MHPVAIAAMTEELQHVGNASSLHTSGRSARRVVEAARERVAGALGCRPGEVIFTSGGTEADNLAVKGLSWLGRSTDARRTWVLGGATEHHAVLDPLQWLAQHEDFDVEFLPVDALGVVRPDVVKLALEDHSDATALVTVMWANNEVGSIQPIAELAALARERGIFFHTDAVQAVGQVLVDFAGSDVDALTVSGHKVGGPQGVGALLLRRDLKPIPLMHGGGQERDVRSGTLDVAAIAGFGVAVEIAVAEQAERAARISALRDSLIEGVLAAVPSAVLNGTPPGPERLPGNAHFSFPGCEGDALLMLLDAAGVEVSTGSACTAGVPQASHVLLAMGADDAAARGSLRFSLGYTSTQADVDALIAALPSAYERARRAGLVAAR
jgi:cysteine desulfurase